MRIVDHRLVENRQQLLRHAFGNGLQSGSGASRQYDAFHILCHFNS